MVPSETGRALFPASSIECVCVWLVLIFLTDWIHLKHLSLRRLSLDEQLDPANLDISNSKPFSFDLPFSHSLSDILDSRYFELFSVSPENSK